MMDDDESSSKNNTAHQVGADLSMLSLEELDECIGLLTAEIERLRQEKSLKRSSFAAADAVFKS